MVDSIGLHLRTLEAASSYNARMSKPAQTWHNCSVVMVSQLDQETSFITREKERIRYNGNKCCRDSAPKSSLPPGILRHGIFYCTQYTWSQRASEVINLLLLYALTAFSILGKTTKYLKVNEFNQRRHYISITNERKRFTRRYARIQTQEVLAWGRERLLVLIWTYYDMVIITSTF